MQASHHACNVSYTDFFFHLEISFNNPLSMPTSNLSHAQASSKPANTRSAAYHHLDVVLMPYIHILFLHKYNPRISTNTGLAILSISPLFLLHHCHPC
jgi:hypothetical protein